MSGSVPWKASLTSVLHPSGKLPTPRRPLQTVVSPKKLLANHEARGAELANINLDNATLQRSYLRKAPTCAWLPLRGADLQGAQGAIGITPEQLAHQTFLLQGATPCPTGCPTQPT